ncbi:MAG: FAD-dependent monooxygenase [Devosiaceae bacterium]|nr:FAD-dependent monooxygenase [Devosiaceae bacterium]
MGRSAKENIQKFDIAIVGGGPAGLTLAVGLVSIMPELKVCICDKRQFKVPDDARSLALAAGVTRIFQSLGIWDEMKRNSCPISRMEITDSAPSDRSRPLFLAFDGEVGHDQPFAHMVPFRDIVAALLTKAKGSVELIAGVKAVSLDTGGPAARIGFEDGSTIEAELVVAADGSRSKMRSLASIKTIINDYKQVGLVSTIAHEFEHNQTAFEHFRSTGPFASLPLKGKTSSLVWTETAQNAQHLQTLSSKEQAIHIEEAMGHCLGRVELKQPIQGFPLRLCIAREFVRPRLALLGDAAHAIHPITGQGLNLGLKDVAALLETIINCVRRGQDMGSLNILQEYERWRRMDVAMMALATDGLNRLFSNDVAILRIARDLGLGLVDRAPLLKNALIRHAAAIGRSEPRLLRGLEI